MKTTALCHPENRLQKLLYSIGGLAHRFRHIFLFLLVLLTGFSACKNYKIQRNRSFSQIEILKNNALLVRLNTAHSKIEHLKNAGKLKEAEKEQALVAERNQKIMSAFREHYTFSNVYFFNSGESEKLKNKQFDQVTVFDGNNNAVSDRSFLKRGYLVAAFTSVYQDQTYIQDENNTRYAVTGTSGLPALVVMDADYIQLRKPFPYRVMIDPNSAYEPESVDLLNDRLHKHYAKYVRKKSRNIQSVQQ